MVVHLRHPLHGEKIVYNEQEAANDRANGWVVVEPSAPPEPVAEPVVASVPSFLAPAVESDIPASFPARDLLIAGGITTWAELVTKTESDLVALKGIGPATAREILEEL